MEQKEITLDTLVSLCKRRGFIYPGSEIYGGLAGTFDYGPLGVALKNNIKNLWWKMFVIDREDMYGVDAAILMNPRVWEASGHVSGFNDPMVECTECGARYRVDHLVANKEKFEKINRELSEKLAIFFKKISEVNSVNSDAVESHFAAYLANSGFTPRERHHLETFVLENFRNILNAKGANVESTIQDFEETISRLNYFKNIVAFHYLINLQNCQNCKRNAWSFPRQFNMMFATKAGAAEDEKATVYLRPETAGGMFVNFKNVVDSFHPKLPFGLAQIGKAFRNEIAPRDFVFRSREFEQMEVEYFVRPSEWEAGFEEWRSAMHAFAETIGLPGSAVHELEVAAEDRAHYSKRTIDFEFDYPFGRKELWGLAYRTDFDLSAHEKTSGVSLGYQDEEAKEKLLPHVIEPSLGVDRTLLAVLLSAYREDELGGEKRSYLAFAPAVAPYRAAVFPLLKNKPELVAKAREVYQLLKKAGVQVAFDDNGNIGKRYRRQDEIGTPSCITIDFDTLGETAEHKDTVTIRDRDTGGQERIAISDLLTKLRSF